MAERSEPLSPKPFGARPGRGAGFLLLAVGAAVVLIAGAAVGAVLYFGGPGHPGAGALALPCADVPAHVDRPAFTDLRGTDAGSPDPNTRECSLTGSLGGQAMTIALTVQRFAAPGQAADAATRRLDGHCGDADPRTPAAGGTACMSLNSPHADGAAYVVRHRGTLLATVAGPAINKLITPEQLRIWYEELAKFATAGLSLAR